MNALVAYFSAEGTTARLALALSQITGADLFEIKPEQAYSAADINWKNPLARCNMEKIGKKDVPVQGQVSNWEKYDLVYLGFPIWYYGAPNIIQTFCKAYDWSGKSVSIFATSGGSEIGKTAEKLMPYMSGASLLGAKVFRGTEELRSLEVKAE